jgi:hypothetical protein
MAWRVVSFRSKSQTAREIDRESPKGTSNPRPSAGNSSACQHGVEMNDRAIQQFLIGALVAFFGQQCSPAQAQLQDYRTRYMHICIERRGHALFKPQPA